MSALFQHVAWAGQFIHVPFMFGRSAEYLSFSVSGPNSRSNGCVAIGRGQLTILLQRLNKQVMPMTNILLYAPDLFGHPQIYCRAIADILIENNCKLFLLAGISKIKNNEQPVVAPLLEFPGIEIFNSVEFSGANEQYLTVEELIGFQRQFKIDGTIFIEADKSRAELSRVGFGKAPRLLGKNVGIFSRTSAWCPGEEFYSGEKLKWYAPTFKGNLSKIKRTLFNRKETDKYFYEKIIFKKRVLDAVLVKDERIIRRFGPPVYWMPDIYKPFDELKTAEVSREYETFADKYQSFLGQNKEKDPVLFFGQGTWYRGYEYFLKLIEMDQSSVGVHIGAACLKEPGKKYNFDIEPLRRRLICEKRLFETNCFIHSERLIDLFFSTASRVALTHRLTGSSGTMLYALEHGKPVLTPSAGLVGYRTLTNQLGMTYNYLDENDLAEKWREFRKIPISEYSAHIAAFMKRFSREEVARVFIHCLCE